MRVAAIVVALMVGLSLAAQAAHPRARLSDRSVQGVSVEDIHAEITFGMEVAARIIGKYSLYDDDELTRYVNLLGKSIAMNSNRPELDLTIGILDTDIINAYSAPGGYIFITKGAIQAMDDEAQLAGVLAHEIIHVTRKHIVNTLKIKGDEGSAIAALTTLVSGVFDTSRTLFSVAMDEAIAILFERGHKRNDEIESDTLGATLAAVSGYDPESLNVYFQKLKRRQDPAIESLQKLYPPFDKRIAAIHGAIMGQGLEGGKRHRERFVQYTARIH